MTMVTSLLLLFAIALGFSLAFTPVVRTIGIKLGAMDIPMERKVHTTPIPRIGGLAVFLSFAITTWIASTYFPHVSKLNVFNFNSAMGHIGAIVVFGCGLCDDFRRLKPWTKLFFQIAAATLAYIGGATITGVFAGGYGIHFNVFFSYAITVFWFLLFINAINLIDGLDGLASGLVFFNCLVMIIPSYINGAYLSAFYFTIMGGAVLGFLRYNFNPAIIFLGDGGSYFLGYMVALLAIQGSMKSQVGALMLIPLLALGVPIFDSILAPVRRWVIGRKMFQPDKGHIHHQLLRMGFSSRNSVLLIYGITMALCIIAIFLITFRGHGFEGISLALLLFGMIFLVRKLGYLEYLALDKIYGWFQDVTDVAGFSQKRRSFLSLQIAASKSQNMDDLWGYIIEALEMLNFNQAQLYLTMEPVREWKMEGNNYLAKSKTADSENKVVDDADSILKFEIPLREYGANIFLGKLVLIKDLKLGYLQPYTIRRVEHLRRTLIPAIKRLKNSG
jgi:UDP-GlcNAc:undecaprenyl-phosphate GlcNAc-1-phosphate transferase